MFCGFQFVFAMRIVVIGGMGTIGGAVVEALQGNHDVIVVGHTSGQIQVDLADPSSITQLYQTVGTVEAVVSCAGEAAFGALDELDDEDFDVSVSNKLMGQVNLVRFGLAAVKDGGVFTLTSGVLSQEPMVGSAAISMVNAGLEGFVRAAALEVPRGIRVNVVSPPWVEGTLDELGMEGPDGLPATTVAEAYLASIEGEQNGETIDAREIT